MHFGCSVDSAWLRWDQHRSLERISATSCRRKCPFAFEQLECGLAFCIVLVFPMVLEGRFHWHDWHRMHRDLDHSGNSSWIIRTEIPYNFNTLRDQDRITHFR